MLSPPPISLGDEPDLQIDWTRTSTIYKQGKPRPIDGKQGKPRAKRPPAMAGAGEAAAAAEPPSKFEMQLNRLEADLSQANLDLAVQAVAAEATAGQPSGSHTDRPRRTVPEDSRDTDSDEDDAPEPPPQPVAAAAAGGDDQKQTSPLHGRRRQISPQRGRALRAANGKSRAKAAAAGARQGRRAASGVADVVAAGTDR